MTADNSSANVPFNLYDHEISWQPFAGIENLELTRRIAATVLRMWKDEEVCQPERVHSAG